MKRHLQIAASVIFFSAAAFAGGTTYSNIEQMAGWTSCGSCAGAGGNGPAVPYSMAENISSPSIDGRSARFWVGGSTPYGDALWWKQLGANSGVSHFTYDIYFYYTNASAPQALEFDVNQSVGGRKYIFGTQCNVAARQFDVWNTSGSYWMHTGVACTAPPAYRWNHLVWQLERVNGQTHFISVTLNGATHYISRYGGSMGSGGNELNVAFQMDLNNKPIPYTVYLDKVTLRAW